MKLLSSTWSADSCLFKMAEQLEQRQCINFCQKLGDGQTDTIRKIKRAFSEDAMEVTQIKLWFKWFKDGRMSADSDQRSGRPSTSHQQSAVTDHDLQQWKDRWIQCVGSQVAYYEGD